MPKKEPSKAVVSKKDFQAEKTDFISGTNYLLAIGIDKYINCTPLNNAVKDATDVIKLLTEKYNFQKENIVFITDEKGTKDNIIDAFRKLKKQLSPPDNLVIYYSGHGELDEDFDDSYLVTVDSRKGKIGDYLPHEQLIKFIRAIQTHHTLLILDACFAGAFLVNRRSTTKALEKDPSRYVIASGRKEFASDGVAGENSPFAAALLEKLSKNEGDLSVIDLAQYVKTQTIKATNATQRPIHNPLQIKEDKGGEFIFRVKIEYEHELNTFTDFRDGQVYKTVKLKDGNIWMAQNLNFNVGDGCWFYDNDAKNGEIFGRLYTWEAAMEAYPRGWRLPSDKEIKKLIDIYGGINNIYGRITIAYNSLIKGGDSGFNALLGGKRLSNGKFFYIKRNGSYWSATGRAEGLVSCYNFNNYNGIGWDNFSKYNAFSCRCIKD
ncbi:MAG: FISUMP domain-containing protein [Saprospiraceae bacterium]